MATIAYLTGRCFFVFFRLHEEHLIIILLKFDDEELNIYDIIEPWTQDPEGRNQQNLKLQEITDFANLPGTPLKIIYF